jgi:2-octaprenyl-6-methoxyphenol hydroxylase
MPRPLPIPHLVVAGGGMAGLAAALALDHGGRGRVNITLLDPQLEREQKDDARASAITAGSRRMLETLGVWEAVVPHAQAVSAMDITDARMDQVLRPVFLTFDGESPSEIFAHIVPNTALQQALLDKARRTGITLKADGVKSATPENRHMRVETTSGNTEHAELLVAADGAQSRLRQRAGIADYGWRYDRTAIATTIAHTLSHQGRATQHFLDGGPFALLPLTGNRSSIVWTEPHAAARRIMALPDEAFTAELAIRAGGFLGEITLAGSRAAHPLALRMARSFIAPRLALVGDAAHGLHPVAGQGINLGFRDVAALAEAVSDALDVGGDGGSALVLQRYQQWRRFDTLAMLAATDALVHLFAPQNGLLRTLRDIGMGLVDRFPPVKNALIRSAAGASGKPPKLLKGEPL